MACIRTGGKCAHGFGQQSSRLNERMKKLYSREIGDFSAHPARAIGPGSSPIRVKSSDNHLRVFSFVCIIDDQSFSHEIKISKIQTLQNHCNMVIRTKSDYNLDYLIFSAAAIRVG